MFEILNRYFTGIKRAEVERAADMGYADTTPTCSACGTRGPKIIAAARAEGKRIMVSAGRPYHVDPEVNHGIDALLCRHGAAVVTEDSVAWHEEKFPTTVLNQWTYHSRLYAAAKYCTTQEGYGSGAAGELRLRRGRHHHRRDPRDPARGRQAVHPAEDRSRSPTWAR